MRTDLTTADIAERLNCAPITVLRIRKRLNVGVALMGRAGYRYSEADWERIEQSLRPVAPVRRERKRKTA